MRKMHVGIILSGALVGVLGAVTMTRLKSADAGPPQTHFVGADGASVVLPDEPTPLPLEPEPVHGHPANLAQVPNETPAILLQPEPMSAVQVTVGHRSADEVAPPQHTCPTMAEDIQKYKNAGMTEDVAIPPATAVVPEPEPADVAMQPEKVENVVPEATPTAVVEDVVAVPEMLPLPTLLEEVVVEQVVTGPEEMPMPTLVEAVVPPAPENIPAPEPTPVATEVPAPAAAPEPAPPSAPLAQVKPSPLPLPQLVMAVAHKRGARGDQLPVSGTFTCTLDETELNLTGAARDQLDKPRVLFVALAPDKRCLWLYTSAGVERLADQLDRVSGGDELARCTRRMCFSRLQRIQVSSDGTYPLPVDLIDVACLKGNVLLIGVRDHYELWDERQWQQYIGQEEPAEHKEPTAPSGGGVTPSDFWGEWNGRSSAPTQSLAPSMSANRRHDR